MQILQETQFTVAELKAILSDDSKMIGILVMNEPKASAPGYTDMRELMSNNNDDQESVASEATQRTVVGNGGVLKTRKTMLCMRRRCGHILYSGVRLQKANVRRGTLRMRISTRV